MISSTINLYLILILTPILNSTSPLPYSRESSQRNKDHQANNYNVLICRRRTLRVLIHREELTGGISRCEWATRLLQRRTSLSYAYGPPPPPPPPKKENVRNIRRGGNKYMNHAFTRKSEKSIRISNSTKGS